MQYARLSASERQTLPPAIAVSAVAFAIEPPADALIGNPSAEIAESTGAGRGTNASDTLTAVNRSQTTLWIPLVRRTREPYLGAWALPGGPTEWHETLTDTALRTLTDAVLRPPGYLEQLYAFGAVERSAQAQRLVTIAYWAQYGESELLAAPSAATQTTKPSQPAEPTEHTYSARATPPASSASRWDDPPTPAVSPADSPAAVSPVSPDPNVAWFSADQLPPLAFDHADIVAYALWRLRMKTEYSSVAHRFLGQEFTVAQLRRVHEAILGHQVDPANFRRQVLAGGDLVETGAVTQGTAHRPAKLYRFRGDTPNFSPDTPQPQGTMQ